MKHESNLGPRTSGAREETNFLVPMKRKMRKVTPKKRAAAAKMKKTPTKKLLSNKAKKHQLFRINDKTGKTGTALMRAFNTKWTPNKVNISFVKRNITPESIEAWQMGEVQDAWGRKEGSGGKKKISKDMEPAIEDMIEDDDVMMKEVPGLVEEIFGVKMTQETITNHFKKKRGNATGYTSHVTPLATPLTEVDEAVRLAYALYGPINSWSFEEYDDVANKILLPRSWKERRRLLAWWDHKPFYLGKFHRHNCRQCRFNKKNDDKSKKEKKPLVPGRKEKFSPKFMVFGLLGYAFSTCYFHCHRRRNMRRSRNEKDDLVYKYTFEHISVNQAELNSAALQFIPTLKANGIRVLIGDCDTKLHNKKLAEVFWEHGILLWPGGGRSCGRHPIGYPPRSHDCNPCELWFSGWQNAATKLMKKKKKQSMLNWKRALEESLKKMKKASWQKLINTQPKVMNQIIQNKGGPTKY